METLEAYYLPGSPLKGTKSTTEFIYNLLGKDKKRKRKKKAVVVVTIGSHRRSFVHFSINFLQRLVLKTG